MYSASPTAPDRSTSAASHKEAKPSRLWSFLSPGAWTPRAATKLTAPECAPRWGRLMVAAQSGDSLAYRELLTEIALWVRTLDSDHHQAEISEETVRAVLLRVHKVRSTYHRRHPFGPWICAVVSYSLRSPVVNDFFSTPSQATRKRLTLPALTRLWRIFWRAGFNVASRRRRRCRAPAT
jgi:hypothetical protein